MADTMLITLDEMKGYLRVGYSDDDELIESIIANAEAMVRDAARLSEEELSESEDKIRIAVLYAAAYMYEHREEADYKNLTLSLRDFLFGVREAAF